MTSSTLFDAYRPHDSWYKLHPVGLHGIGHTARVLVWAEQVAQGLLRDGVPLDVEVVRWAAALHDVRRADDGADPQHGSRAAAWIEQQLGSLPIRSLAPAQIAAIRYCCTWHVPGDQHAPWVTPELACLKDGDGLDRVRLWDLDPRFLRTRHARDRCGEAQELHDASQPANTWESVRAAALSMELWK